MFISCMELCFHSPYHKTCVICLTRDKKRIATSQMCPLNQLCAPRNDGRDGEKKRTGDGDAESDLVTNCKTLIMTLWVSDR